MVAGKEVQGAPTRAWCVQGCAWASSGGACHIIYQVFNHLYIWKEKLPAHKISVAFQCVMTVLQRFHGEAKWRLWLVKQEVWS